MLCRMGILSIFNLVSETSKIERVGNGESGMGLIMCRCCAEEVEIGKQGRWKIEKRGMI